MAIQTPKYNIRITATVGERYSSWEVQGETQLTLDVADLDKLPKVGTLTEGLLTAAVLEHRMKVAKKALIDAEAEADAEDLD